MRADPVRISVMKNNGAENFTYCWYLEVPPETVHFKMNVSIPNLPNEENRSNETRKPSWSSSEHREPALRCLHWIQDVFQILERGHLLSSHLGVCAWIFFQISKIWSVMSKIPWPEVPHFSDLAVSPQSNVASGLSNGFRNLWLLLLQPSNRCTARMKRIWRIFI